MELLTDHPAGVLAIVGVMVLMALAALTALIVFTRWVVHTEVTRLTAAIHDDVRKLGARLDLLIGRRWTDEKLDRRFEDVQSVLNLHDGEIARLRADHMRFHGPRDD